MPARSFMPLCLLLPVLLAPLGAAVLAQEPVYRHVAPQWAPKSTAVPEGGAIIDMARYHRLPQVEATINGQGPFRFVIDTGAPGLVVSNVLRDKLALPAPPEFDGVQVQVQVASTPGEGGRPATIAQVESLKVGAAEFRGLQTIAAELPFGDALDGIIGFSVFRDCLFTLDYPAAKLRLTSGELPAADDREVLAFKTPRPGSGHPSIPIRVGDETLDFTIDSGLSGWFRMSPSLAERCGFVHEPTVGPRARMMDKEITPKFARLKGRLGVGGFAVERPIVMVADEGDKPLVGSALLENFAVCFDQKNQRVRLAREGREIAPPAMRSLGLGLERRGGRYVVWHVEERSPAAGLGIATGDVVEQIEGKPTGDIYGRAGWQQVLERPVLKVRLAAGAGGAESSSRTLEVPTYVVVP